MTLQPVDRYPLDAAILFSDILTIPDAMGLGLSFVAGEGPKFAKPVQDEAAVKALYVPDPSDKLKYVTDAVCEIKRALNNRIPLIGFSGSPFTLVFTKGFAPWVKEISEIGADAMGLDWTVSLGEVRALTQDKVALQGNLDPSVLFAGEDVVRQEARKVIEDFGHVGNGGHVFNLGHGIDKDTDPEVVAALVDEVHSYSRKFHSR